MHCELVVPGLLGTAVEVRLPALERLLARGRPMRGEPQSLEAWLPAEFGLEPARLAAGALTVLAGDDAPGNSLWARADPVHLRLLRDRMVVLPSAAFSLGADEARALCESLNAHFEGRLAFQVHSPERWVVRLAEPLELPPMPALAFAGQDVAPGMPADALLNEIQMALHEHPVNEAREARGEPAVNSLWLWGAGTAPRAAKARWRTVTADDPLLAGLARAAQSQARPPEPTAQAWLQHAPEEGRHLVVLQELRAPLALADPAAARGVLAGLERAWFAPLLEALGSRVGMVTIHVPDAGLSVETIRGDLRRFWRRPKPLAAWVR